MVNRKTFFALLAGACVCLTQLGPLAHGQRPTAIAVTDPNQSLGDETSTEKWNRFNVRAKKLTTNNNNDSNPERVSPTDLEPVPKPRLKDRADRFASWYSRLLKPMLSSVDGESLEVSLDGLVISTLESSSRIEVARMESFIERERVTQQDAQFDFNAFARSLFNSTNRPTSTDLDAGRSQLRLIQQDQPNELGIRRKNRRGGIFEAKQGIRFLDNNSVFLNPTEQGLTQLVLRYNQPLLRDGGRLVNQGQVVVARMTANAVSAEADATTANVLEELVRAYWEVFRLRGRYAVQQSLVEELNALMIDIRKRSRIDARRSLVGQAEASLATQTAELATIRTELIQAQHQLVRTVGDDQLGYYRELIPTSSVPETSVTIDASAAMQVALTARPEIRAAAQRIRRSEMLRNISDHQLLPSLALILETTVSGLRGDYDAGQAFVDQFSRGGPGFVTGLAYDLPVGNRAAKSRRREAELALARDVASMDDTVDQVRLEVNQSLAGLRGASEQYQVRLRSAEMTRSVVDALLRRRQIYPREFDQISQLFVSEILAAFERRSEAELELVDLMAEYATTTIRLRRAMGTLLSEVPFAIDGPKEPANALELVDPPLPSPQNGRP